MSVRGWRGRSANSSTALQAPPGRLKACLPESGTRFRDKDMRKNKDLKRESESERSRRALELKLNFHAPALVRSKIETLLCICHADGGRQQRGYVDTTACQA